MIFSTSRLFWKDYILGANLSSTCYLTRPEEEAMIFFYFHTKISRFMIPEIPLPNWQFFRVHESNEYFTS